MTAPGPAARVRVLPVTDGGDTVPAETVVRDQLQDIPPRLPPWLGYDDVGSRLFEQITELPTYHLTRVERGLLERHAPEIAELLACGRIAELGSGSAKKTRLLLESCLRLRETAYLPIDVDRDILCSSGTALVEELDGLEVTGLWGRYEAGLDWLRANARGPLAVLLLGSGFGNATRGERAGLLREIARTLPPGGGFLVSADLDKDGEELRACYNDPPGYSAFADFRLNYLTRLNDLYGAGFVLDDFVPRAYYNAATSTVEGVLLARSDQEVPVPGLGITLRIPRGESLNVGYSVKFDEGRLVDEVEAHGFDLRARWLDDIARYGLFLFRRRGEPTDAFTGPAGRTGTSRTR
ncbi:L-histidine N(alpha)-methyltransferase [Nocardiopsis changdeensis]|uniref:L-histidine N(Alpha)-methyltransferase n=1 Tax=Nocardiopsis changdeensis TaxID=2831969 RepID=A0ABX8BGI0_9ACTN|nr:MULTISPECIES: L-histidine N(alpha)-methyltransferase [Nocardiopsis]QUX20418.1 L-histidine N(alpha)-methyltransferase [Nocardiopsis changdeensis]QYX36348.1 L-histidine N(alpha)-methyltransferase [Nocardiopsis sp. MT53]